MLTDSQALEKIADLHYLHQDGACICGLPFPCPTLQVLLQTPYARRDRLGIA